MAATERAPAAARALRVLLMLAAASPLRAGVLPEDRADLLYHGYDGGGVEVDGPSVLVLKSLGQSVAVSGNYYVDSVSSASPDVVTQGSPYADERTQWSAGVQYLAGKSTLSLSYIESEESDYSAETVNFGISTDLLGDLTTVSLGYTLGSDEVRKNVDGVNDPEFGARPVDRRHYRLGVSQILTKSLVMSLNWETITDEGFLNNPYRGFRYVDDASARGFSFAPERYPSTRTSNAAALRARYFLPYRAALRGEYRWFDDSWGVDAWHAELGYTQPLGGRWTLDAKYRRYEQSEADFYADLFDAADELNFQGRDKELSRFASDTYGLGVIYELARGAGPLEKASLNLYYDRIDFDYENYRDLRDDCSTTEGPGCEPLYGFSANVWRLFASFWF